MATTTTRTDDRRQAGTTPAVAQRGELKLQLQRKSGRNSRNQQKHGGE
ncbi:hypothetical protein HY992_05910 [Candidatus Micrarchaeota archaeon]|nr:hypothetical protein [Candidatus Micrarchaeota archaeon]